MSDKFRTSFVIPVTFTSGEQPTHTKLNAISTQSKNGLALLERAIGDLWNQSGDSVTSDYPNRISNLARALGDQSLLNAKLPLPNFDGVSSVRIRQRLAATAYLPGFLGRSEIVLDFSPINDSTLTTSINNLKNVSNSNYTGSSVATVNLVDSDLEWFLDPTKGKIHLGSSLHLTQTYGFIEYNVLAADFPSDSVDSSGFSMIPPETQLDWKGLKISLLSTNKYYIVLPFRRPETSPTLVSKVPQNDTNSSTTVWNSAIDSTVRYWGPSAATGFVSAISSNKFYRQTLPRVALDLFTGPVAGTVIPSGTIYLWDTVLNTVVEGITFKVPETPPSLGGVGYGSQPPFILQAEGSNLDRVFNGPSGNFTTAIGTDVATDYQSRFALICVGQSLAKAVGQLRKELVDGNPSFGIQRKVSHRDLIETQPVVSARHLTNFPPTFVHGDDHPHLLSRMGSAESATTSAHRDRFNNAMLGDLLIGSIDSAANYQNLTNLSNYIYFGSVSSSSPSLRMRPAWATPATNTNTINVSDCTLALADGILMGEDLNGGGATYFKMTNDGALLSIPHFGMFNSAGTLNGHFWGKKLLLNASSQSLTAFDGTINSTNYLLVESTSTTNQVTVSGSKLELLSDHSEEIVVGNATHLNTDLRIHNSYLYFGTVAEDSYLLHNAATNTWTAVDDGSGANNTFQFGTYRSLGYSAKEDAVYNSLNRTNIPKAWGTFNITTGGVPSLVDGFNMAAPTLTASASELVVSFASGAMLNDDYTVLCTYMGTSSTPVTCTVGAQSFTQFEVALWDVTTHSQIDLSNNPGFAIRIGVLVFGRQVN